jgi:hypothetical protein
VRTADTTKVHEGRLGLAECIVGPHAEGCYFILDCPGQVELFTLHESLQSIVQTLTNRWHIRCAGTLISSVMPPAV